MGRTAECHAVRPADPGVRIEESHVAPILRSPRADPRPGCVPPDLAFLPPRWPSSRRRAGLWDADGKTLHPLDDLPMMGHATVDALAADPDHTEGVIVALDGRGVVFEPVPGARKDGDFPK
jgi:hypothetical protein